MCLQRTEYAEYTATIHSFINGPNEFVNTTKENTIMSRLYSKYGFRVFIVAAYGWLHAGKSVTGVVELLVKGLPCPQLYEFFLKAIVLLL